MDIDKIFEFEGGFDKDEVKLHVPTDKDGNVLGNSGATLPGGIDLGQMDKDEFYNLLMSAFSDDKREGAMIYGYLSVYCGKKGKAALNTVNAKVRKDLFLAISQARAIALAKYHQLVLSINPPLPQPFSDYPEAMQTVIASVAIQYGPGFGKRCPTFYKHICNYDLRGMIQELREFGDSYRTRRNKEADILEADFEACESWCAEHLFEIKEV